MLNSVVPTPVKNVFSVSGAPTDATSVTLTVTFAREIAGPERPDVSSTPLYSERITRTRVELVAADDYDTARAEGVERITAAIGTAESMAEELGASVKANAVKVKEVET